MAVLTTQIRTEVRFLLAISKGLKALQHSFQEAVRSASTDTKEVIFAIDWVGLYELELRQVFGLFLKFSNLQPEVEKTAKTEQTNLAILELAEHFLTVSDEELHEGRQPLSKSQLSHVAPLAIALDANFRCLAMFGMYLNTLLKRCDVDDILFKAVLVDPAVLRLPRIAKRVSLAQASDDQDFLTELSQSISRSKHRRHVHLDDLRLALAVLSEMVDLDKVSDDELVSFLHDDLDLLGARTEDPARSIKSQIKQLKKLQAQ